MTEVSQTLPQGEPPTEVVAEEPPLNLKATLISGFPTFGGILFGYDAGYIAGVLAMDEFKLSFGSPGTSNFTLVSVFVLEPNSCRTRLLC
jgi:hypothetical protein